MKNLDLIGKIGITTCLLAAPAISATTTLNFTGCLARGEKAHQYVVTDNNGQKYGLLPDPGVNMRKHVGQKVMITGDIAKAKRERRAEGAPADEQFLRVNQVKKVSDSCQ
jgi:hypothetical protein